VHVVEVVARHGRQVVAVVEAQRELGGEEEDDRGRRRGQGEQEVGEKRRKAAGH
jgi:hypothetical protein